MAQVIEQADTLADESTIHSEIDESVEKDVAPLRLPFAFARKQGVAILAQEQVLADGASQQQFSIIHRRDSSLAGLSETQRFLATHATGSVPASTPPLVAMDDEEFEQHIAAIYARDSHEARQMVEDLGDEVDLASLADAIPETEDLLDQEEDAPIIRLINALLAEAIKESASDIHIETFETDLVVRFRVDGVLREIVRPKRALAPLLVSRIKVMARLDIAEKRVPQDGRISLRIGGREVDVRVSTMPSTNAERVVMRLLDKQAGRLRLTSLGMADNDLKKLQQLLANPHGILLVTGPTGSGKTTTLYAALSEINRTDLNILTVEDPIEYNLTGIGQTQVNPKADMTFARGLRAILRQDPDVVMVGEIRDLETAEIAVQASLTGHLVMSTLHTNSAVGAVTRLDDMGVEPFLLSSSLVGVLAQRLVRVLCEDCKNPYRADHVELDFLQMPMDAEQMLYAPVGCSLCGNSGFRGRTGIYELLLVDERMRELIHDRVSEQELIRHARTLTTGIREDGRRKVLAGQTTVEEILRVSMED